MAKTSYFSVAKKTLKFWKTIVIVLLPLALLPLLFIATGTLIIWVINHLIIYLIRGGQETSKMRICGFINGDFLDDGVVSASCNRSDANRFFPSPWNNVLQ